VEVGVGWGFNAVSILTELNVETLYLVDHYQPYQDAVEPVTMEQQQKVYLSAQSHLASWTDAIQWVIDDSLNAPKYLPDSVDFVYLDAFHSYDRVIREMSAYYPLLRSGGILAGHDFSGNFLGVVRATLQFAEHERCDLITDRVDWWMVKP
jgi:predicted O-methyltransferase YrrM